MPNPEDELTLSCDVHYVLTTGVEFRDMGRNPQEDANRKAAREMHKAVDKVIDEKKKEPIGTKEAEEEVAADLNEAAHEDTKKDQRRR